MKPWIGVDLDGTLAVYNGFKGVHHIGEPVPEMVDRVRLWISEGKDVRIFTARIADPDPLCSPEEFSQRSEEKKIAIYEIKKWCFKHIGKVLPITCVKDYGMVELYDDRCVQVEPNTGRKAVDVAFSAGYSKGLADGATEHGVQKALEDQGGITD